MTLAALNRRLRKIEATRSRPGGFFLAWGRTKDEAQGALDQARTDKHIRLNDEAAALVWPDPEPVPPSRWVAFDQEGRDAIPDRELKILHNALRSEAVYRERDRAVAAQEDVTALDETDFYIRHLRRYSKDLTQDLRFLCSEAVPEPEIHHARWNGRSYDHCQCDRCLSGETTLLPAHTRTTGLRNAWLARYLPGEMLFT